MGINTGIKVIRRITDEQRWKEFVRAVVEYFKDDTRVCMEVIIDLNAPIDPSLNTSMRLFHLTEAFNFVPSDDSLSTFWHTKLPRSIHQSHSETNVNEETKRQEATFAKLKSEVARLNYTDVDLEQLISHQIE